MHTVFIGILLGWGAAIPVGPVNLEMARRSLAHHTLAGIVFGLGACSADLIYLIVLCLGAMVFLQHPVLLNSIGLVGSAILLWFAYQAFTALPLSAQQKPAKAQHKAYVEGLLMTLFNPYTILFWASISSQISLLTGNHDVSLLNAGIGLLIGTVSWVMVWNTIIHVSKKRLSDSFSHRLNQVGGVILLGFGLAGMAKSFWELFF